MRFDEDIREIEKEEQAGVKKKTKAGNFVLNKKITKEKNIEKDYVNLLDSEDLRFNKRIIIVFWVLFVIATVLVLSGLSLTKTQRTVTAFVSTTKFYTLYQGEIEQVSIYNNDTYLIICMLILICSTVTAVFTTIFRKKRNLAVDIPCAIVSVAIPILYNVAVHVFAKSLSYDYYSVDYYDKTINIIDSVHVNNTPVGWIVQIIVILAVLIAIFGIIWKYNKKITEKTDKLIRK